MVTLLHIYMCRVADGNTRHILCTVISPNGLWSTMHTILHEQNGIMLVSVSVWGAIDRIVKFYRAHLATGYESKPYIYCTKIFMASIMNTYHAHFRHFIFLLIFVFCIINFKKTCCFCPSYLCIPDCLVCV